MKPAFILLALLSYFFSSCQTITIKGTVINEEGAAVPGATIIIKGTNKKTLTDDNGQFTIHNSLLTDTIIVSAVGYQTTEEPNNVRGLITITLNRSVRSLSEVIVSTGYQDIPKERATGSFEKIDADLIEQESEHRYIKSPRRNFISLFR